LRTSRTGEEMAGKTFTRGKFVGGSAAVVGGLSYGLSKDARALFAGGEDASAFAGTISEVASPDVATLLLVSAESVQVTMLPKSHIFKEQPVDLTAFVPDEQVVVAGEKAGDTIKGFFFMPLYMNRETTISAVSNDRIITPIAQISISKYALYWTGSGWDKTPPKPLAAGAPLRVAFRFDPPTKEFVGVRFDNLSSA
jgi:hypothetical protein